MCQLWREHLSRTNECETWKKEKEIMKLKVTNNLTYPEARKLFEQKPEFSFSKVVKSLAAKPETKTISRCTALRIQLKSHHWKKIKTKNYRSKSEVSIKQSIVGTNKHSNKTEHKFKTKQTNHCIK